MHDDDPARTETPSDGTGPATRQPPAEVAQALATLMAMAATLEQLDLDGVAPACAQ